MRITGRLSIRALLILLPLLRATAAVADAALEKIVSEESAIEGSSSDIRAFHDAVLDDEPMPRSILHEQISRWIEATQHDHPSS